MGMLQPTHPYLWIGVGLYLVGAAVMAGAIYVHRRPQHRVVQAPVRRP